MGAMTPDEAVLAMAARLAAVDWERRGDKSWSKAALFKEYLRRLAGWAGAYDCEARTPFFDLAACVDPGATVDQAVLTNVLTMVEDGGWDVTHVVPFVLRWAALSVPLPRGLEDPFEPLVVLFERGGGFHTENGEVNLEWKSVRLAGWRKRATDPPLPGFGTAELDEIDRAGSTAHFGYVIGPDGPR
jgi:hypothetical protein